MIFQWQFWKTEIKFTNLREKLRKKEWLETSFIVLGTTKSSLEIICFLLLIFHNGNLVRTLWQNIITFHKLNCVYLHNLWRPLNWGITCLELQLKFCIWGSYPKKKYRYQETLSPVIPLNYFPYLWNIIKLCSVGSSIFNLCLIQNGIK